MIVLSISSFWLNIFGNLYFLFQKLNLRQKQRYIIVRTLYLGNLERRNGETRVG